MTIHTIHTSNLLVCRAQLTTVTCAPTSFRPRWPRPDAQPPTPTRRKRRAAVPKVGRVALAVLLFCCLLGAGGVQAASVEAAASAPPSPAGFVAMGGVMPILAQAAAEPNFEPIYAFLSKVMTLVGVSVVFYGGWKVHKGEPEAGIMAIIGGFIISMAIPIIKFFSTLFF